jgi:DegV family protein with EDD domain
MPTTSRPAPVDVADLYQKAMDETGAEAVVVLTVSQDVSGTYPSAIEAQKMVDFPVHVLDTRTISLALGMTTMKVAEARDQGATIEEALELARTLAGNSHVLFSPSTLEFLRRGGRIGAARHLLGTALSIKPILHVKDGHVEALESIRTRKKAVKRMFELSGGADRPRQAVVRRHHPRRCGRGSGRTGGRGPPALESRLAAHQLGQPVDRRPCRASHRDHPRPVNDPASHPLDGGRPG